MVVWARIVESDKPVFTVIFGGTAAFATAISEAAKHLKDTPCEGGEAVCPGEPGMLMVEPI